MGKAGRGRHQSTDKEGRRTIQRLQRVQGVLGVVIGESVGGKSLGRQGRAGAFRLQGEGPGGFRGVLQTSRGIQEIFVRLADGADREAVAAAIGQITAARR